MIKKEELVKIGQFVKTHGTKGEIGVSTTCDVFDDSEDPYIVVELDGIFVPFFIESYRYKTDTIILLKLENIDTDEQAREFTNREVYYPLDEMDEEENMIGEITWDNFIGYSVFDTQVGPLGKVLEVDESTLNVILKIQYNDRELLIPAVEEIIIDANHPEKHLTVSLPEGLLDL